VEQRSIGKESTQGNQRGNGDFVGPENGDTFFDVMCEPANLPEGRLCAETSHNKTSGPRGRESVVAHTFRVA
jgi:hypothetical protein